MSIIKDLEAILTAEYMIGRHYNGDYYLTRDRPILKADTLEELIALAKKSSVPIKGVK